MRRHGLPGPCSALTVAPRAQACWAPRLAPSPRALTTSWWHCSCAWSSHPVNVLQVLQKLMCDRLAAAVRSLPGRQLVRVDGELSCGLCSGPSICTNGVCFAGCAGTSGAAGAAALVCCGGSLVLLERRLTGGWSGGDCSGQLQRCLSRRCIESIDWSGHYIVWHRACKFRLRPHVPRQCRGDVQGLLCAQMLRLAR